ncbi:MAG: hypothetical protein ACTSUS_07770, partial [Candidatus Freyarchaeota archaeon]
MALNSEEAKAPIRVKLKVGSLEIEIECREDQLQGAIEKILATVTERMRETPLVVERTLPPARVETCKGVI